MSTVVVDRLRQLLFPACMGGTGKQRQQRDEAERNNAGTVDGLAHEADSSEEVTTEKAVTQPRQDMPRQGLRLEPLHKVHGVKGIFYRGGKVASRVRVFRTSCYSGPRAAASSKAGNDVRR